MGGSLKSWNPGNKGRRRCATTEDGLDCKNPFCGYPRSRKWFNRLLRRNLIISFRLAQNLTATRAISMKKIYWNSSRRSTANCQKGFFTRCLEIHTARRWSLFGNNDSQIKGIIQKQQNNLFKTAAIFRFSS